MLIIALVVVLATGFLTTLIRPSGNTILLHPQNAEENGAMALTRILKDHGVDVRLTGSISEALSLTDSNTTVMAYDTHFVSSHRYEDMLDRGANLVLVDPTSFTINQLDLGLVIDSQSWEQDPTDLVSAQCSDPHAQAANEAMAGSSVFSLTDDSDSVLCFTVDGAGPYATSADGRVRVFSEPTMLTNATLATAGHAALTIGALGEHEKVVWLIPSLMQNGNAQAEDDASMLDFLPPWFNSVLVLAVFVTLALAVWRGRRMGRLVVEPLPVIVRGSETVVGLGGVYRRSNEVAHAAASLRAGTALRCAQRLGVAPTASGSAVASAIAHAVKRPYEEVAGLLLGPVPRNETDLITLAQMLDRLESEVHAS